MLTNHFYPLSKPVSPEMCLFLGKSRLDLVTPSTPRRGWLSLSTGAKIDSFE